VRSIGADKVVNYTTDDLSRIGRDFDAGFDLIGGETLNQMLGNMKPGARSFRSPPFQCRKRRCGTSATAEF
jgi:NADPH:quinone reductase-like Zn-dependent oxidoreductase